MQQEFQTLKKQVQDQAPSSVPEDISQQLSMCSPNIGNLQAQVKPYPESAVSLEFFNEVNQQFQNNLAKTAASCTIGLGSLQQQLQRFSEHFSARLDSLGKLC